MSLISRRKKTNESLLLQEKFARMQEEERRCKAIAHPLQNFSDKI
jgi:hypothetical protein